MPVTREGCAEDDAQEFMVNILGGLEVRCGDLLVAVGHARQRSVLAALAIDAGRVVPVGVLIDRIWGERPPFSARPTLRTYVAHLRRALARARISITYRGDGYLLAVKPDMVDLHRFRALWAAARENPDAVRSLTLAGEALALWRGEPLAESNTQWADSVRRRLHLEHAAAQADQVDWALRCGKHRDLLPELTTRAAAEPSDERVVGQLMLALYRSGRQAEALRHFQHTRRHLADELGTDPSPALNELHQRILTADPGLTTSTTVTEAYPAAAGYASVTVPRQLPAPPRRFIGRTGELAHLTTILEDQGTAALCTIAGFGGVGKTWLALAWAHNNLDRFPDGQLFIDLRGFSPDEAPVEPVAAVRGFLDALGADSGDAADLDTQAARFRSLVADKRMLIVLDNAATTEQIVPLLPGSRSCTVLVTSRHRLPALTARHSAQPLTLGVLTHAESQAMLAADLGSDVLGTDEQTTVDLIGLCGGMPLALAIVAARARARTGLALSDAVAELRDSSLDALASEDPTASLPTVLSWSLRHLTDEQRLVFALLGIAPGPDIGLPAAASLSGLPERRARSVLRVLEDASLVERRSGGRYAMHDLVRTYAATLAADLPDSTRRGALKRVVEFYLHTANVADHLLDPHRQPIHLMPPADTVLPQALPDYPAALSWLNHEYHHILGAQQTAAAHHWHQATWQLAWSLHTFQFRRGHYDDELPVWNTALDAAEELNQPAVTAMIHRRLGLTFARLGRHDDATEHLDSALTLSAHHTDMHEQAYLHYTIAWVASRHEAPPQAHPDGLRHARQAMDLYRTLDNTAWQANTLTMIGWYETLNGNHGTAREHCNAALRLARRDNYIAGEADSLVVLGWIDQATGHHHQAVEHHRLALTLLHTLGHTYAAAPTLATIANSYAALGRHEQAITAWRQALELYRKHGREDEAERIRQQLDEFARDPVDNFRR
ncbi:DNA-binding SARP family transcriptional activator [Saccharothrix saharensis]|uniref:DNA-binding SARP family transcriptional activator n=1 Tax=Saccharothrix saharensis TaxID=571190 RepID=A0A543J5T7_9PSEU|nr:BTAD domain-containing putative transcriptional regulator [Saccharothrix saharensis]TQM78215.1 DNA-binding SARP family transcriptional activator [Saccharothrix saharensis]